MPVTAKLSKEFYEKFGTAVVNELVDWLNQVDATYRSELREINELNFTRFDARLEQRVADIGVKLDRRITEFEVKIDRRITALEVKLDGQVAVLQTKLDRAEFQAELGKFEGRMLARFGVVDGQFGTLEGRLIRVVFLAWATLLGAIIALR